MHLGVLHCGHLPDEIMEQHGPYRDIFARFFEGRGWRMTSWDVVDLDFPGSVHHADAWLLTGSRHGAYEEHDFIAPLEDFIRDAAAEDRPMLGICFGHQIIAQALGARVEKFAGGWELGRKVYAIDGLGEIPLNAWHQDQVLEVPEGAEVVASTEGCAIAALAYGESILTIQPHPEFSPEITAELIRIRGHEPTYPRDRVSAATDNLRHPVDSTPIAAWMGVFLERAVAASAPNLRRRGRD
ncbi:MAG: type 1 glutamine amidotransferase [Pseudomonadota bacterium]